MTRHPPLYPSEGFGRIGCFAGPGLYQFYNGPNERTDSAARAGPWLVLDSLRRSEAEQLQPRPVLEGAAYLQGTLIYDDDSTTIIGRWRRPTTDSIVLAEHRSHPPVSWHFRWQGNDLLGEARLRSDMSILLPNGRRFSPTHAWPVDLVRVSCGVVPSRRPVRVVRPEERDDLPGGRRR